jgi:hypothetical protein
MPSRTSFRFADSGTGNFGEPHSRSRMVRIVNALQTTYDCVHIAYWLVVGAFLMLLPWQYFWDNNYFVYRFPFMRSWMANPYVKWAILGLGIANLIIGFQEIASFRKSHQDSLFR